MMPSHKWHFEFTKTAKRQLKELSSENRMRVFRSIAELLQANDPQSVYGVKKLEGIKPSIYRQRQGDYRILFYIETRPVVLVDFAYAGIVYIIEIALHHEGY